VERKVSEASKGNDFLQDCQARHTADVKRLKKELAFETSLREGLASTLESYSCKDPVLNSSEPVRREAWVDKNDMRTRAVHVMHELPASKIHVIANFVSEDECNAIDKVAGTSLRRASVGDRGYDPQFRKAMGASIEVPWELEQEGHPIARLSRRVYDYTNHVLEGLDIQEAGQAKLKFLHYSGRGRNDTEPDHYFPHCDGACSGSMHGTGARVATMIMYW
jgi:hypothetical protein